MRRIGIIDLGSNTVRLVVYDVKRELRRHLHKNEFKTLLNEKETAGLSAYVEDGIFTDAGIEKAIDSLEDHLESARNINCSEILIFATAVLRNCSNSTEAVKTIERAIDAKVDLITGEEEAKLGFIGASINNDIDNGFLIDIGGGSTEISRSAGKGDLHNISLDMGCMSSYANFVSVVFPTADEIENIRSAFRLKLDAAQSSLFSQNNEAYQADKAATSPNFFGIGGSVRSAAKMKARMLGKDKAVKTLTLQDVDSILDFLVSDREAFAHMAVKAAPDRLHTLVPGCVMLKEVLSAFGGESITVCKYGIREGYLVKHVLKH